MSKPIKGAWSPKELKVLEKNSASGSKEIVNLLAKIGYIRTTKQVSDKLRAIKSYSYYEAIDSFQEVKPSSPLSLEEEHKELLDTAPTYDVSLYVYDEDRDLYLIPTKRGILNVSGDRIRNFVKEYSNYGDKKTQIVLAREFGWAKDAVIEILRRLRKTHDSAPFTDEIIDTTPVETLVSDLVRIKENKILVKAQAINQAKLETDANRWRTFETSMRDIIDNVQSLISRPVHTPKVNAHDEEYTLFLYHTDAHIGKEAWDNATARKIILNSADAVLARATRAYGKPTKIVGGIGGDWCNIDTTLGTTTRGTPQPGNSDWFDIMQAANGVLYDLAHMLSDVSYTDMYTIPGNHDEMWSVLAGDWMSKLFANDLRLKVHAFNKANGGRNYHLCGKTLLMLLHGNTSKPDEYPSIMAAEAPELWGKSRFRYIMHGHHHHEVTKAYRGATRYQMNTIEPGCHWGNKEGYIGVERKLTGYIFSHTAGKMGQVEVLVDHNGNVIG